jgi:hypothetical protein
MFRLWVGSWIYNHELYEYGPFARIYDQLSSDNVQSSNDAMKLFLQTGNQPTDYWWEALHVRIYNYLSPLIDTGFLNGRINWL